MGDPKHFNIQWDKKGNTLLVQSLAAYQVGNLAVQLKGLDTPVMVTLMPGQHAVDYRVDLRIPRLGPQANVLLADTPTSKADPNLLDVLNGIPPRGAKSLLVQGVASNDNRAVEMNVTDMQAWLLGSRIFLRTRWNILSPGWIAKMRSADGTYAYEIQRIPVILVLHHGQTVPIILKEL